MILERMHVPIKEELADTDQKERSQIPTAYITRGHRGQSLLDLSPDQPTLSQLVCDTAKWYSNSGDLSACIIDGNFTNITLLGPSSTCVKVTQSLDRLLKPDPACVGGLSKAELIGIIVECQMAIELNNSTRVILRNELPTMILLPSFSRADHYRQWLKGADACWCGSCKYIRSTGSLKR